MLLKYINDGSPAGLYNTAELIDRIKKGFICIKNTEFSSYYVQAVINEICNRLNNLPSVELERKKGEWNFIGDNMFKCTCCGVLYTTHQLNGLRNYDTDPYAPYFCPNCGANMRG